MSLYRICFSCWNYLSIVILFSFPSMAMNNLANNNAQTHIQPHTSTLNIKVFDVKNVPTSELVVYLEPVNKALLLPLNTATLKVSQKDKAFMPYLSVMQKGSSVHFLNQDDITHHIYSPVGENKFSFKIKASEEKVIPTPVKTGEIAMGCNIHDWMSGYILVVDTPYFTKTEANGSAVFSDVIPGDYVLNIWHPQLASEGNKQTQQLSLNTTSTDLSIKLKNEIVAISIQVNDEDFDFLSEY